MGTRVSGVTAVSIVAYLAPWPRIICLAAKDGFYPTTTDAPVFDHSSISHFVDRIGRGGLAAILAGLNDELLRLGMLSPEMYVDDSLVKANVNGCR